MNQRTKILTAVFGAAVAYALFAGTVYPHWIKPLVTIEERIASRQKTLDELNKLEDRVQQARFDYKTLVNRIGSFDPSRLQNDARVRLNALIDQHKLQEAKVTPSRISEDRKTGIKSMMITLTATGKLESVISFMQDIVELPYLLRMGNVALYPAGSSRRKKPRDLLNMRVPIELLILPKKRIVGVIQEKELKRPEMVIRHQGHDYSPIWLATPFIKFIPPIPLRVEAGSDVKMKRGQRRTLSPSISGGDKPYTFQWLPFDGLSDPTSPKPRIDTTKPFERVYTLTVTDAEGKTATDTLTVTVEPRGRDPKPPEPRSRDNRWPDRRNRKIVMTLLSWVRNERVVELMVYNTRKKTTEYFGLGAEFDGGELVYVHQTGGLVRRNKEYFIYPIGYTLDKDLAIDHAAEYPELKQAYQAILDASKSNGQSKQQTKAEDEKPSTEQLAAMLRASGNQGKSQSPPTTTERNKTPAQVGGKGSLNSNRTSTGRNRTLRSAGSVRTTRRQQKKAH